MSQDEDEDVGTGLRDVYELLVDAPLDRVTSLTFQLGESPAEMIVHAFCLIILRRREQALNKLQMLGDSYHAQHLAGILEKSDGDLADFRVALDVTGESLQALACVFKVLSEQRLCEPVQRNLAYKRALSTDNQICEDLEYNRLKEEARDVCGPEFAVWMSSQNSLSGPCGSVVEGSLKVYQDSTSRIRSLQASCPEPSYPSHLEISAPPTDIVEDNEISSGQSPGPPLQVSGDSQQSSVQPFPQPEPSLKTGHPVENKKVDDPKTRPKADGPPQTANVGLAKTLSSRNSSGPLSEEEEDEETFYPFVILHAPEDTDDAEDMKEKMESIIGTDGATFSEDFNIPGRSALRCIEDAINNSAYTVLLLTRNFNTRMLEVKTDTALINSITNRPKYNTVIPLLPSKNGLPKEMIPPVLKTLVPLEENKSFEKKLKKVFTPAKLKAQQRQWTERQRKRQQRHLVQNQSPEHVFSFHEFAGSSQTHPSIHIENAKYIMIGNDSRMTVDHGCASGDDN